MVAWLCMMAITESGLMATTLAGGMSVSFFSQARSTWSSRLAG